MANKKHLSMKLLIDTRANKVLFAEAGKDVVDFLFSLLGMPVGSIVKLLSKDRMVGCVGNLYHSLEGLDTAFLQPNRNKTELLNPVLSSPTFSHNTLLLKVGPTKAKKYYKCSSCRSNSRSSNSRPFGYSDSVDESLYSYVTDGYGTPCPSCRHQMTTEVTYVDPKAEKVEETAAEGREGGGLVKGVVTYTIMDDLTVTPMSTISSITLLNKLQVKDMSVLQEKSVELGFKEGLELLKASLQSTTVLTNVFFGA